METVDNLPEPSENLEIMGPRQKKAARYIARLSKLKLEDVAGWATAGYALDEVAKVEFQRRVAQAQIDAVWIAKVALVTAVVSAVATAISAGATAWMAYNQNQPPVTYQYQVPETDFTP